MLSASESSSETKSVSIILVNAACFRIIFWDSVSIIIVLRFVHFFFFFNYLHSWKKNTWITLFPGWVPVELTSRQHCWHLSAVDYTLGLALVLRYFSVKLFPILFHMMVCCQRCTSETRLFTHKTWWCVMWWENCFRVRQLLTKIIYEILWLSIGETFHDFT